MTVRRLVGSLGIGLILGGVLGAADVFRLVLAREMFFDTGELFRTASWTLGICLGAGILTSLALGEGAHSGRKVLERFRWTGGVRGRALAIGFVLVLPLACLLLSLTSGPQASRIPGRILIVVAAAVFGAALSGALLGWLPRTVERGGRRARVIAALSTVTGVIGLHAADAAILVRLYPVFHVALTVAAGFWGWFGLSLGLPKPRKTKTVMAVLALGVCAMGFSGLSLWKVLGTQNARFVIAEKGPTAADVISLALLAAPPPPDRILDDDVSAPEATDLPASVPAFTLPGSDVFLITVDAMRYDRLQALGATRSVAPNIDRLAKESVVFSRAYTPVPHTSYAITSLLSGKYTQPLFDVPGAPPVQETWPEILRRFRYETSGFFTPAIFFIDRARFEPYLRKGAGFQYRHADSRFSAQERVELLIQHLEEKRGNGRPHFAWIHFFDPHEPYEPVCPELGERPEDRYDCEIHRVDEALAPLFRYLKEQRPGAVVIVTSDHGEEFGDHGGKYHGSSLYDEQVRVPLIVHAPTLVPRIVDTPVSLVDLLGTTLRILDIPVPARVRSRDLTPLLTGEMRSTDAFAEAHGDTMVVYEGHKLICNMTNDLCRLYDLAADPLEMRSVADAKPQLVVALKNRIAAWNASHAPEELRPIRTDSGAVKGWPAPIRRALGGDGSALPALAKLIAESKEPRIRQKAAELIYDMAARPVPDIGSLNTEDDVRVAVWLLAHQVKTGVGEALPPLAERAASLDSKDRARREAALARMAAGDIGDTDVVLETALDDDAPMEQRRTAVRLLAGARERRVGGALIPLLNVYQLTLEVAATLAALKTTTAVEALVLRLKRERFLERKAALMDALARIGDRAALGEMAAEMFNEIPPPGALGAILDMVKPSKRGKGVAARGKGRKALLLGPVDGESRSIPLLSVSRAIVRTDAATAGGSVVIVCNGKEAGRVPIFSGQGEGRADLSGCERSAGHPLSVQILLRDASADTRIESAALLSGEIP